MAGRRAWLGALLGLVAALPGVASAAAPANAAPAGAPAAASRPTVVLPTVIVEGGSLRAPRASDGELAQLAASLDALLADTAQDLGLSVDLAPRAAPDPARLGDAELLERARALGGILLLPAVRAAGPGEVELRLVLADAAARSLHVRSERAARDEVPVRAVIMLRDLAADAGGGASRAAAQRPAEAPAGVLTAPARSGGRPVLLVANSLFGGFVGYSVQRASGSDDPRVLYPLIAVGAGIGIGASIIAAEEWDVTGGEAWYLAAGATWPTLAGHLVYEGRFAPRLESDRWVFGLVGGASGVTLSVLGMTLHGMSDGGALIAHSGGTLGLVLGGLTEALVDGDIHRTPWSGMGYGAGLGWLGAAALATQIQAAPSRVLTVDLGALLGGLGGAALGSPLLFGHPDATRERVWLGAVGAGALVGATVAIVATRGPRGAEKGKKAAFAAGLPGLGVLGESEFGERRAPIVGVSWAGALP